MQKTSSITRAACIHDNHLLFLPHTGSEKTECPLRCGVSLLLAGVADGAEYEPDRKVSLSTSLALRAFTSGRESCTGLSRRSD